MLRKWSCPQRMLYSANRLLALDEYCRTASQTRVFLVLLLFCTPAMILMTLFDCVPLQDPSDGWQANVTYWLRVSVGSVLVGGLLLIQLQAVVAEIVFPKSRTAAIAVGMSAGYTGSLALLAACWKFPIPFTYTVAGMPMMTIMTILVLATLGTADRTRVKKYFKFSNVLTIQASTRSNQLWGLHF